MEKNRTDNEMSLVYNEFVDKFIEIQENKTKRRLKYWRSIDRESAITMFVVPTIVSLFLGWLAKSVEVGMLAFCGLFPVISILLTDRVSNNYIAEVRKLNEKVSEEYRKYLKDFSEELLREIISEIDRINDSKGEFLKTNLSYVFGLFQSTILYALIEKFTSNSDGEKYAPNSIGIIVIMIIFFIICLILISVVYSIESGIFNINKLRRLSIRWYLQDALNQKLKLKKEIK